MREVNQYVVLERGSSSFEPGTIVVRVDEDDVDCSEYRYLDGTKPICNSLAAHRVALLAEKVTLGISYDPNALFIVTGNSFACSHGFSNGDVVKFVSPKRWSEECLTCDDPVTKTAREFVHEGGRTQWLIDDDIRPLGKFGEK